jgi:hypothetical protein
MICHVTLTDESLFTALHFPLCSVRSKASIRFFPKLFCGYFYLFHIYFFCFPYGFSYLAWLTTMLFILHATMHLMNHYEIPAFEQGLVTARNPRIGLVDLDALARAEEAAAAMLYTPQSNGAVFRRMQALRRAAQLAEEAGLDTPQRRGRRSGTFCCCLFLLLHRFRVIGFVIVV